jgi:O-antigen/teichoic acid export membrane protein
MKIRRNVAFNLLGFLLPALLVFGSFPLLLRGLGAEKFGILSLAMSVAATLSFLDFGLAAATLRFVVADLNRGDPRSAGRVMTTSMLFFGAMGGLITVLVVVFSPWLVGRVGIPLDQHYLGQQVLRLTALQIGFTLILNVISSLFKAIDRFDLAATLVTLVAFASNAVPAMQVAWLGVSLPIALSTATALLAVISVIMIFVLACKSTRHGIFLQRDLPNIVTFRRTMSFGATLTLHGLIGMLFTHGQRLLVGVLFGPIAVAAYQLSLTLVSKVHALINAAAEVALPIASSGKIDALRRNYLKNMLILSAMSAAPLLFIAFANEWLINLWLGRNAPTLTAQILPALCVAYFFVAISALPYHILNGLGHPNVNVWFAVFNIVVYVAAVIGLDSTDERSPARIAYAYAIANIACGVLYQWFCLRLLVRSEPSAYENAHRTQHGTSD